MFLHIGLPGMSGYEIAQQLRSASNMNELILVALAGWGFQEDPRRAQSVGFDITLPNLWEWKSCNHCLSRSMQAASNNIERPPTKNTH
jgi:hypothetical protein